MKKLIIALLLITASVHGQDSLKIQNMQYNLCRSHQQFKTGTIMSLIGLLAVVTMVQAKESDTNIPELGYIGGGLMTVGAIIQLDSHKFIGRAGTKKK